MKTLMNAYNSAPVVQRKLATACAVGCLLALFSQGSSISTPAISGDKAPLCVEVPQGVPSWSLHPGEPDMPQPFPRRLFSFPVTVTGYSSTPDQTDTTPFITASNTRVRRGIVAMSRDLLREFTPGAPFSYGDKVELEGVGVFTVEDTMNPRFDKRIDIWFSSRAAARQWGCRGKVLSLLSPAAYETGHIAQSSDAPLFEAALAD
jgi:3D (Asp-Asp-Asp) domain-containing protein